MFVHNHRTVAIWMKMPVGKKGWGCGTEGRNPDERDRDHCHFSHSTFASNPRYIINNWTTIMDGWETLLSKIWANYFIDNWSLLSQTLCQLGQLLLSLLLYFGVVILFPVLCVLLVVSSDFFFFNCAKCVAKYALPEKLSWPLNISQSSYICIHDLVWLWNHPILLKGMWY